MEDPLQLQTLPIHCPCGESTNASLRWLSQNRTFTCPNCDKSHSLEPFRPRLEQLLTTLEPLVRDMNAIGGVMDAIDEIRDSREPPGVD